MVADAVGYELTGHAAFFQDGYKLVRNLPPVGDGEWHLHNILSDPGEAVDLRDAEPARFQGMLSGYERFAREHGVMPLPDGYTQSGQLLSNFLADRLRVVVVVVLITILVLLPFLVAYRYANRPG